MLKVNPSMVLLLCVVITVAAVGLKITYNSFSYFNSIMILTIMLTSVLKDFYTKLFTFISFSFVIASIAAGYSSGLMLLPQLLVFVVMGFTCWGVLYIKRLYKTIQIEKQQMDRLFAQRKDAEERLIVQKELLERTAVDIRRLNASLENKVEERTLILKEALQELERSQGELNDALNKEKELSDIKSRFLSMASHEFRTPLSTILSSTALLGKYTLTEEQNKRDRHLNRIRDSVKHLNDLLGDFLNLGKLDEGKINTTAGEFNAREFIQDVCDEMKPMLKENQSIQHGFRGNAIFTTDKRLLKNILINLISNAIKFSSGDTSIHVDVHNKENALCIDVRDKGIGIAEEDLQHLFSSFFRGKNAFNIEGTGLGLNIVRKYADLLNGTITVSSELAVGTTFHLELPLLTQTA